MTSLKWLERMNVKMFMAFSQHKGVIFWTETRSQVINMILPSEKKNYPSGKY